MPDSSNVDCDQNTLHFGSLSNPAIVGIFLRAMSQTRQQGYDDIILDFGSVSGGYPDVCVPIAGLLDHYRSQNVAFTPINEANQVTRTSLIEPRVVLDHRQLLTQRPLNTVWKYSSPEEVNSVVNAFLREVSRKAVCEIGVIQGLEWCLNEVLDNVLQHAETTDGYVMGQIHPTSHHIAICIYDHGRGIFNSLRNSSYAPQSALDAITMAIKEGVTRDKEVGQGNGLWGLHNIVRANSGLLGITSGNAHYRTDGTNAPPITSESFVSLSPEQHCTTVDFQINFDKPLQVAKELGGFEPVNLAIEDMEDNTGNIIYRLAEKASGTGTRRSGQAIRKELINLSRQCNQVIVVDFSDVGVVSSSFADEFIGKLVAEVGFIAFTQRFRLIHMNDFVEAITNRAVTQRISLPNGHNP